VNTTLKNEKHTDQVSLLIPNFTSSGLGDRMVDVFLVSLFKNCYSNIKQVFIPWFEFKKEWCHHSVPQYRFQDILMKNILSHMNIPSGVELISEHDFSFAANQTNLHVLDYRLNGAAEPQWLVFRDGFADLDGFYNHYLSQFHPRLPYHVFKSAIEKTIDEFSFCDEIQQLVSSISNEPFACVHIRRTDKVRQIKADKYMIDYTELDELDELTRKAILKVKEDGLTRFYISCDSETDQSYEQYREFILGFGGTVIPKISVQDRWKITYYELAIMIKSSLIIQSQVSSGFSNLASLLGRTRLLNVFSMKGNP
jgi:hypothetical protein